MWRSRKRDSSFYYTYRKVRRQAAWDGRPWKWRLWPLLRSPKPSQPPVNQQALADYEREIKEAAEHDIQLHLVWWKTEDSVLKAAYCAAEHAYRVAYEAYRKETAEAGAAQKTFDAARQQLLDHGSAPTMDPRWALAWLVFMGVGEFFLNALGFEILGQNRLETYLLAAGLGMGVPLGAHYVGQALRQERKTARDWWLIATLPVVFGAGLWALAFLRAKFSEAAGREFAEVFHVTVTHEEFTRIFLLLNVLLFFVAAVVSYAASHENEAEYGRLRRRYREAKRWLRREAREAQDAIGKLEAAQRRLQKAKGCRASRYAKARHEALRLKETAEWFSQVYRMENLRHRRDGRPPCFDERLGITVTIPKELEPHDLADWDCGAVGQDALPGGGARGGDEEARGAPHG